MTRQFANYLTGKPCKVYCAPFDVRLFYAEDESDDTVVQPDIVVICDPEKRGYEGCRGAPEFAAEILSPSNSAIEMELKFDLYRQAGVREYWVLDPEHKSLHAHRFEAGQIQTRSYNSGDTAPVDIIPGLEITLEPVFAE
jgi:Uma2 family endonuclease